LNLLVEVDLPYYALVILLQFCHYLLEVLHLGQQVLVSAAVVVSSLFLLDLLQFIGHQVQFGVDFSIVPDVVLEVPLGVGDALLDVVELAHHAVEVIVDEVFLPVDFALDEVGIGVDDHLQRLDVAVEVGDLVLLVSGGFHQVGQDAAEGHAYVLLRLFLRVSSWKLF
jgi:hypothetical protein